MDMKRRIGWQLWYLIVSQRNFGSAKNRNQKEDRVTFVVSGSEGEKLRRVPKVRNGTGLQVSQVVFFYIIQESNIQEKVVGMSFDTTPADTWPR